MFVEDRVQRGVLAADVEDVTEVLDLLGRADPARDELLPLAHLLRQLVLECRDLHGNDSVIITDIIIYVHMNSSVNSLHINTLHRKKSV